MVPRHAQKESPLLLVNLVVGSYGKIGKMDLRFVLSGPLASKNLRLLAAWPLAPRLALQEGGKQETECWALNPVISIYAAAESCAARRDRSCGAY